MSKIQSILPSFKGIFDKSVTNHFTALRLSFFDAICIASLDKSKCHTPKFGAGCQKTACCSWFWAMILTTNLHTHILKYQSNVHVYKLGYCLVYPLILCKLGIENKPCCLQSVINYYSFVFPP